MILLLLIGPQGNASPSQMLTEELVQAMTTATAESSASEVDVKNVMQTQTW